MHTQKNYTKIVPNIQKNKRFNNLHRQMTFKKNYNLKLRESIEKTKNNLQNL